jgi:hypothetical protein
MCESFQHSKENLCQVITIAILHRLAVLTTCNKKNISFFRCIMKVRKKKHYFDLSSK